MSQQLKNLTTLTGITSLRKDTARLIMWEDCNMSCYYCCNQNEKFNSQFIPIKLQEIDLSPYSNICISGGEPFLYPMSVFDLLSYVGNHKNIFIYTNGVLLTDSVVKHLSYYKNIKAINVGIHNHLQLTRIPESLDVIFGKKVFYAVQDSKIEDLINKYPERLKNKNIKPWTKDECDAPNEHWFLLKDFPKEKWED